MSYQQASNLFFFSFLCSPDRRPNQAGQRNNFRYESAGTVRYEDKGVRGSASVEYGIYALEPCKLERA